MSFNCYSHIHSFKSLFVLKNQTPTIHDKLRMQICVTVDTFVIEQVLLLTGSEERGVLVVGSIPVTILPSCQFNIASQLHRYEYSWVEKIRNT